MRVIAGDIIQAITQRCRHFCNRAICKKSGSGDCTRITIESCQCRHLPWYRQSAGASERNACSGQSYYAVFAAGRIRKNFMSVSFSVAQTRQLCHTRARRD